MKLAITSIDELKELAESGVECFVALGGSLRSSKLIEWDGKNFHVFHENVGVWETWSEHELANDPLSNITRALNSGGLYRWA